MSEDLSTWADRLEAFAREGAGPIDRVRVVAETGSTQDAAWEACGGRAGLMVVAGRQTAGRGRLGRAWIDRRGRSAATTLVLDASAGAWRLAMLAGIAAARACDGLLLARTRTRWPNDVLEPGERGRKLGGVLVEVRSGLALVGVGVNVRQTDEDWFPDLAEKAASLAQLGAACERIDVLGSLLREVSTLWGRPTDALIGEWRSREWLIGKRCVIAHDGRQHAGVVRSIDPYGQVVLDTDGGEVAVTAASASVVGVSR